MHFDFGWGMGGFGSQAVGIPIDRFISGIVEIKNRTGEAVKFEGKE